VKSKSQYKKTKKSTQNIPGGNAPGRPTKSPGQNIPGGNPGSGVKKRRKQSTTRKAKIVPGGTVRTRKGNFGG
jgi:hypothetical protein